MILHRRLTSAAPRARGWTATLLASVIVLSSIAVGGYTPAEGAEGRIIEMTSAVPERGYWLRPERVDFEMRCLDDEGWVSTDTSDISSSGWWGTYGYGLNIAEWATPGTHVVVIDCVLIEDRSQVMESKTFHIEVGSHTRLEATVGTVDGECATTSEITVDPGTEVFWCYTLLPHPDAVDEPMFTWWDQVDHTVDDTLNGELGTATHPDVTAPLGAGMSSIQLGIVSSTVVDASVTNTATWATSLADLDSTGEVDRERHMPVVEASARVVVTEVGGPDTTDPGTTDTTDPGTTATTVPGAPTDPQAIAAADPAHAVAAKPTYTG